MPIYIYISIYIYTINILGAKLAKIQCLETTFVWGVRQFIIVYNIDRQFIISVYLWIMFTIGKFYIISMTFRNGHEG